VIYHCHREGQPKGFETFLETLQKVGSRKFAKIGLERCTVGCTIPQRRRRRNLFEISEGEFPEKKSKRFEAMLRDRLRAGTQHKDAP
jgi:hypothetical protein